MILRAVRSALAEVRVHERRNTDATSAETAASTMRPFMNAFTCVSVLNAESDHRYRCTKKNSPLYSA